MLPTLAYRPTRTRRWAGIPELERIFDDFLTVPTDFNRPIAPWTGWGPTADLYETDDEFVLEMEIPGYEKDEVDVTLEEGILTITGNHLAEREDEAKNYHVKERMYRRFTRTFNLPHAFKAEAIKAELEHGILFVRLPKLEEAKPKKIAVAVK